MYAITLFGLVIGSLGVSGLNAVTQMGSHETELSSMIVLVESPALGTGKSGTGKETDAGRGTMGKKSEFGSDQPTSGDFSPNPSSATTTDPIPTDKTRGSEQPAGIGEKGSGQTRSTTERSGGPQPSASESMSKSKSASKLEEGKTERAAKELQSKQPSNR